MDQHIKTLQTLFADDAERYDNIRFGSIAGQLYCEAHYLTLKKMLRSNFKSENSTRQKPFRILDVAMGTGRSSIRMASEGIEVVGIDVTIEMMQVARRKKPSEIPLSFVQGDAFKLPFNADSFDAVICCRMLQMIPLEDYSKFGVEISRILRSNGIFIAELWNRSYQTIRCLGQRKRNTWGLNDTFITTQQRRMLFGNKFVDGDIAGLGFPLVLPILGRISKKWTLKLYLKLTQCSFTKNWGETFFAQYRLLE